MSLTWDFLVVGIMNFYNEKISRVHHSGKFAPRENSPLYGSYLQMHSLLYGSYLQIQNQMQDIFHKCVII